LTPKPVAFRDSWWNILGKGPRVEERKAGGKGGKRLGKENDGKVRAKKKCRG